MNNKRLGNMFERRMCEILVDRGYWVHFMAPDARGAQPFDLIAVKDGKALAIDCKTSVTHRFSINRLEDNQIMAFRRWLACGNEEPMLAVLYQNKIYLISYSRLETQRIVNLKLEGVWYEDEEKK